MKNFINEKFSTRAKRALIAAEHSARGLGHTPIRTAHLVHGIMHESSSFASEMLFKNNLTKETVRLELVRLFEGKKDKWRPSLSKNLKKILEKSAIIAAEYNYKFIGTEHLLYSTVSTENTSGIMVLDRLEVDVAEIQRHLRSIFENSSRFPDADGLKEQYKDLDELGGSNAQALEYFTLDITERAKKGLTDPLIGRAAEIERVISILGRRTKNNPVLIGEPGVGKTAIVEGLAHAINERNVPEHLLDTRILNLDLALMVAGSMFRGEFENRLKQIIEEVQKADDIILFIDELHTVVGAGATTGSLDAANILKPVLARGDVKVIGATTLAEYKKYIEEDSALERRFQHVMVNEPSEEETYQILKGLKKHYESHHNVTITNEAIESAVTLSTRFLTDRFLPDKAIDILDEAAAYEKTKVAKKTPAHTLKNIERTLKDLAGEKHNAVVSQNFKRALAVKKREEKLEQKRARMGTGTMVKKNPTSTIRRAHIARTISRITGVPLDAIEKKEAQRLMSLEERMKKNIIGQENAIAAIASAIKRARTGVTAPHRPLGSFLFLGPSGVGKTYTAKILARELFGSEDALTRIDMSEFMERHNVSRLIGAPAGYVGYGEGGTLTETVRRKPYTVILLDEIEKAHREVHNILLQIFEEGQLTDAGGKTANFRNTIVIMTSNIGIDSFNQLARRFGFAGNKEHEKVSDTAMTKVRTHFRPEFVNRIDHFVVFNPLDQQKIESITQLEVEKLKKQLSEQGLSLSVPKTVIRFVAEKSFDHTHGGRLVRKNIQKYIETPIAEYLLKKQPTKKKKMSLAISKKNNTKNIIVK